MKTKLRNQKGFTIIEVLIVLAIAGLIMLIVFLAVPALQRNSRNTQRRSDAAHLAGLVNEYVANHAGTLPTGVGTVSGQIDLANEKFSIMTAPVTADIVAASTQGTSTVMKVNKGFICDNATNTLSAGSARAFSISYQVETGGAVNNACVTG